MRKIQLQDAKAKFSAIVDAVEAGESVTVTRRGKPVAVLVSTEEWTRVSKLAPSFADLLLSFPGSSEDIPERGRAPFRDTDL